MMDKKKTYAQTQSEGDAHEESKPLTLTKQSGRARERLAVDSTVRIVEIVLVLVLESIVDLKAVRNIGRFW
jgi:hypothetical protein